MHNFFMQLYFLVCMFKQMLLKHQIKCTCFLMKIAALNFIDKLLASTQLFCKQVQQDKLNLL